MARIEPNLNDYLVTLENPDLESASELICCESFVD